MISIFFSSTFRDMQKERDLIQMYVLPEAESYAQKYSETVNFVDLRWGIDTSQMNDNDALQKIISVCREKIVDSFPYFIAILGKNYGSEVDVEAYPCSTLTHGKTIGITEYEIATRLELDNEKISFFMRSDVEEIHPRAHELRKHIRKYYPNNIQNYTLSDDSSAKEFIRQMIRVICQYIDHKVHSCPKFMRYMNYMRSCRKTIAQRSTYSEKMKTAYESACNCIILTGLEGIGKKSILYFTIMDNNYRAIGVQAANYSQQIDVDVLCSDLYEQILPILEGFSLPDKNEISARMKLKLALKYYEQHYEELLLIVIEDIHKQFGRNWMKILLQLPIANWKHIKLCCTALTLQQESFSNTGVLNIAEIPVSFLSKDEIEAVVHFIYSRQSKELPRKAVDALCKKNCSGYPQYLSMILQSMLRFDENDLSKLQSSRSSYIYRTGDLIANGLSNYIKNVPDDLPQLYNFVYKRIMFRTNKSLAQIIFGLLSSTNLGLREKDLKVVVLDAFGYNELDFYYTFRNLAFLLSCDHEDRYTVRYREISLHDLEIEYRKSLIDYIEKLPENDEIRNIELPYLYAATQKLNECISELSRKTEWTISRQAMFSYLLRDFTADLSATVSKMDVSNPNKLYALSEIMFSLSQLKCQSELYDNLYSLAKEIVHRALSVDDNVQNIAIKYSIMTHATQIAEQTNHTQTAKNFKKITEQHFEKMQSLSLAGSNEILNNIFEAVKRHLKVMEDLKKARKCLDNNLPVQLCSFILDSIEENFRQINEMLMTISYRTTGAIMLGLPHSLSLFHEIRGDYLIRDEQIEAAAMHYMLAEDFEKANSDKPSRNHAAIRIKIGNTFEKAGNLDEALTYYLDSYEELLQIDEGLFSDDVNSEIALALGRAANVLIEMEKYDQAYHYLKNVCSAFQQLFEHNGTIQSAGDYAIGLFKIGELAKASGKWLSEGKESVLRAANIMIQLAEKTQDQYWITNLQVCIKLYQSLGGKL